MVRSTATFWELSSPEVNTTWFEKYATWRRIDPVVDDELIVGFTLASRSFQLVWLLVTFISTTSPHGMDPFCATRLFFLVMAHMIVSLFFTSFVHKKFKTTVINVTRTMLATLLFPVMPFVHLVDYYIVTKDIGEYPE